MTRAERIIPFAGTTVYIYIFRRSLQNQLLITGTTSEHSKCSVARVINDGQTVAKQPLDL